MSAASPRARRLIAVAVVAVAIACDGARVGPPEVRPLVPDVGEYDVVPLGSSPVGGTVGVRDLTDGGLVVGTITPTTGKRRAFSWQAGVFTILPGDETVDNVAVAANESGQVLGRTNELVVWTNGVASPLLPASSPYAAASPVGISAVGTILLSVTPGRGVVLDAATHEVKWVTPENLFGLRLGDGGEVAGTHPVNYQTLMVWDAVGTLKCTQWQHGAAAAREINASGEVLALLSSTAERYTHHALYQTRGACTSLRIAEAGDEWTNQVEMRTMNETGLLAGTVGSLEAFMRFDVKGFAPIDTVLARSGGASADWRVTRAVKLNNTGVLLALASKAGGDGQPVLLVPRQK